MALGVEYKEVGKTAMGFNLVMVVWVVVWCVVVLYSVVVCVAVLYSVVICVAVTYVVVVCVLARRKREKTMKMGVKNMVAFDLR